MSNDGAMLGAIEAVRVFTSDIAGAIPFYRDMLGLKADVLEHSVAIFNTGQAKLILEQVDLCDPGHSVLVVRFVGLSFTVTIIERCFDVLAARGVRFQGPPERQPWGGILVHFEGPDGNELTLVQYPTGS